MPAWPPPSAPRWMPRREPGLTRRRDHFAPHPADRRASSRMVVGPPGTVTGWRLLALLIAISSVGPLSVNIIVPALPGLAAALTADPAVVQLTVSLYFAGLAVAQLMLGPLSDRFGRRPVLLAGFGLTVL